MVAGKAKVSLLTADGNENILYLLKGGDVDGQAALFVRHPRLARLIKVFTRLRSSGSATTPFRTYWRLPRCWPASCSTASAPGWPN